MRSRLRLLVAATTSAVILSFLVPLLLLVHQLASDRATTTALADAQQLASVAATTVDPQAVADAVQALPDGRGARVSVVLPDGTVIGRPVSADAADVRRAQRGEAFTLTDDEGLTQYIPALTGSGTLVVRTVIPEATTNVGVARATVTLCALGLLLLGGALLVGDRLAGSVSRPFHDLADAADQMREGRLDLRVPEEGMAEAVAVGRALNRLASRVEELLVAEREVVADLSHRLRTPVTALRLDTDGVSDPEVADRLRSHVAHLERSVDAIVADARRPIRSTVSASCDAAAVVRERVAFWAPLAEDQDRRLFLDVPERMLRAGIEARELADVVDVLVDNAFAYTPEGSPLSVVLEEVPGRGVALVVADAGPGMPSEDVVDRGSSGAGSSGLGLDIVRRAAQASGGALSLGRSTLGGAQVRVLLGRALD